MEIYSVINRLRFKKELHKKLVYDKNNINRIKYFLMTIESYYKWYKEFKINTNNTIPKPDKSIILTKDATDIEHIYSQESKIKDTDIEEIKNSLGNLTLWAATDNRAKGNIDFKGKKEEYRKSAIGITKDIGNKINSWSVGAIAERESLYCEIASLIFDLNVSD